MARSTVPLNDTQLKNAKPKEKEYKLFDGGGLYLSIFPDGAKRWRLKYLFEAKEKRIAIGVYPLVSLAKARAERDNLKKLIKEGIDPSQERKDDKQKIQEIKAIDELELTRLSNTFEKVARDYISSIEKETVPRYYSLKLARLENHIFPYIGSKPIDEITRPMLVECLERLKNDDKAETARRILQILSHVYRYAVTREIAPHNITADIDSRYVIGKKVENHFPTITDLDEISVLLKGIEEYHGEAIVKLALKLAYLTAQRPGNIQTAKWEEFNLDKNEWHIPAEKMKMKRHHVVPITPQIKEVLEKLTPFTKHRSVFLFPSMTSNVRPISENTLNQALRRLGYGKDKIVAHGFRAMFSTVANEHIPEHGFHTDVIERHLAHKETNKIKGAYNHAEYLKERHGLALWWSDLCERLRLK